MILVIAEKPSVANSIATVLNCTIKENGYIKGNKYIVSWCVGHLIKLAMPESYNSVLQKWSIESLPIIPQQWKKEVTKNTSKQFNILKRLMNSNEIEEIVCATDSGREGELIFRLVYQYANCKKPFKRLWISSLEKKAIIEGFKNLQDGNNFNNLYYSASCRQKADWLVGMNMTRLFSCLTNTNLSIGRVRTPTVKIIVDRDREIQNFKPKDYLLLNANCNDFIATKKVMDLKEGELIFNKCNNQNGIIKDIKEEQKKINPPKLFDLTTLQQEANGIFGYTSQQTLDIVQNLYEKKYTTYPRTDSKYITDDMQESTTEIIELLCKNNNLELPSINNIKNIINNNKVTDHHAIIPTKESCFLSLDNLSSQEKNIYDLIYLRLIMAISNPYTYLSTNITVLIKDEDFIANGKKTINNGWKKYEKEFTTTKEKSIDNINIGDVIENINISKENKQTEPPKHYTEKTLLAKMETAGKTVTDEELKNTMKDCCLGTPATRASIIEGIIKNGYVIRNKRQLISTDKAKFLIDNIPEKLSSPILTGEWEQRLSLIAEGKMSANIFMRDIEHDIKNTVEQYKNIQFTQYHSKENVIGKCPQCNGNIIDKPKMCKCNQCDFIIWKQIAKKTLTINQINMLIKKGETNKIKGFTSNKGNKFSAKLVLENGKITFKF